MASSSRILVADDEPNLRRVLSAILTREGYEVWQASDGAEALERLDTTVDVIITDLKMPRFDGMRVLQTVSKEYPEVPVIMITAFGSVDNAVAAVKAGAFDYIEKPFEQEQIRQIVEKAIKQATANRSEPSLTLTPNGDISPSTGRHGLIGRSDVMQSIFGIIEKVANTPSTVLVTGESGTGKELVAKALHENSDRSDEPFIKINCAAIPKNLMESELFGYEKGAFTGATGSKPGRFELADKGTLFLDEIGEIPVEMQVKLLRAIQESEFERVGGIKTLKVDVRLIAATNRDLEKAVASGEFREDLFYRLNVVPLMIPPLRLRQGDTPLLVDHIIEKFRHRLNIEIEGIDDDAMEVLSAHSWPGNIRELENILERTILFCSDTRIRRADLPDELCVATSSVTEAGQPSGSETGVGGSLPTKATANGEAVSLKDAVRAETSRVEKELIAHALGETAGNVTQAAKLLKISRKSLQMKMKDFGLRDRVRDDESGN
ncbi:MAG: sigma-54-dependent Fis family transcriptional regulator [Myxococcales bacterium]|nr:sigma-54-dependent Fis family transcriptional regulator [Myxococcales bacterium]